MSSHTWGREARGEKRGVGKTDSAFKRRAQDGFGSHPPCQEAQLCAPSEPADHGHFDYEGSAALQLQKLLLIQTFFMFAAKTSVEEKLVTLCVTREGMGTGISCL